MNLATPTNRVLQRRNSLTRLGALCSGNRQEILNGDVRDYGGSGQGNVGGLDASIIPSHGRPASLNVTLPPLAVVVLKSADT